MARSEEFYPIYAVSGYADVHLYKLHILTLADNCTHSRQQNQLYLGKWMDKHLICTFSRSEIVIINGLECIDSRFGLSIE